jgi:Holliday junction resolvase RusA-like endonuclease
MRPASRGLRAWENAVRSQAQRAADEQHAYFTGAVRVEITFVFQRPASVSVKKRPAMIVAPDVDKLCRSCLDGLGNGVLFKDDAQVTHLHARKIYGSKDEPSYAEICVRDAEPVVAESTHDAPLLEQEAV